jgi:hypothetical protein
MKYKTTIQIVTEADNTKEAMDIVGEYLSGNIASGIEMKYATKQVHNYDKAVVGALVVVALVTGCLFSMISVRHSPNGVANVSGFNAVQPPLKTSPVAKKSVEFRQEWEKRQVTEALNRIK